MIRMKKGILVASFGTTFEETRKLNIDKIVTDVKNAYPDVPVYEAYTSNKVRKGLMKRDGIYMDDVHEALEKMYNDKVTNVSILTTHIIDGIESNLIKDEAKNFNDKFDEISLSDVLLGADIDYVDVAKAIYKNLNPVVGNDRLVLMGHGTTHKADESYEKLENVLRQETGMDAYVATVEGSITIEDVIERMKNSDGSKRMVVTPFMLVAGDHANNDMAGEEDSFKTKLEDEGFEPECIVKGLGEYKEIRDIYMKHLRNCSV